MASLWDIIPQQFHVPLREGMEKFTEKVRNLYTEKYETPKKSKTKPIDPTKPVISDSDWRKPNYMRGSSGTKDKLPDYGKPHYSLEWNEDGTLGDLNVNETPVTTLDRMPGTWGQIDETKSTLERLNKRM